MTASHWIRSALGSLEARWRLGTKAPYCPVCRRYTLRFLPFGVEPRDNARCGVCGALERHRLVWLFFQRQTNLLSSPQPHRMLHIAPEACLAPLLRRRLGSGYLTADLNDVQADVKMDLGAIAYPAEAFGVIYCSHVLEHVADDQQALRELHRVLRTDGWAAILVPITAEVTVEDPQARDPQERLRRFGQDDHVRRYGVDFPDRLKAAGFAVACIRPADFLSAEETIRMGITSEAGDIYFCRKGSANP
jgi:SAM-dependent methyltransferase